MIGITTREAEPESIFCFSCNIQLFRENAYRAECGRLVCGSCADNSGCHAHVPHTSEGLNTNPCAGCLSRRKQYPKRQEYCVPISGIKRNTLTPTHTELQSWGDVMHRVAEPITVTDKK